MSLSGSDWSMTGALADAAHAGLDPVTGEWVGARPAVTGELTAWGDPLDGPGSERKSTRNPPRERYEVRRIVGVGRDARREAVSWHVKLERAIVAAQRTGAQQVVWTHPEDKILPNWLDDAMVVWESPPISASLGGRTVSTAAQLAALAAGTVLTAALGDIWWVHEVALLGRQLVGQWSLTKYLLGHPGDMGIVLANGPFLVIEEG